MPPQARQGPRPLALLLASQMGISFSSSAAWRNWNAGSPLWNPLLQSRADELQKKLSAFPADDAAKAIDAEGRRRAAAFLKGVRAYRAHPYRRDLADPPILWREGSTRLLDYGGGGHPVLLIPSLVNRAYILDLTPRRSLARHLAAKGLRVFLMDWGAPGAAEQDFTLTDYIAGRLERALDAITHATEKNVSAVGYCMGGLLALALALRRKEIKRLALLATPWDFHASRPAQGPLVCALAPFLDELMRRTGNLPIDILQAMFWSLDPDLVARKFRNFAEMDANAAAAREFVALEDWVNDGVALAAPVARECLVGWYGRNLPAKGEWRVANSVVRPENLAIPTLVLTPAQDRIVPPAQSQPLAEAIKQAQHIVLEAGHIGMVAGSRAERLTFNPLVDWLTP